MGKVCASASCAHHRVQADGFNPFLKTLADAAHALAMLEDGPKHDRILWQRRYEMCAFSGMWAGYWSHASRGLAKALREHPPEWVPEYMREAA